MHMVIILSAVIGGNLMLTSLLSLNEDILFLKTDYCIFLTWSFVSIRVNLVFIPLDDLHNACTILIINSCFSKFLCAHCHS